MRRMFKLNPMRKLILEVAAKLALKDFRSQWPKEFEEWRSYVTRNGPPKDLTEDQAVRWTVYLDKLRLSKVYPIGREYDRSLYRQ